MEGDWKLIHYYEDGRDELYNLAQDTGEATDLAYKYLKRTSRMRKTLDSWLKNTDAKFPSRDQKFDFGKRNARWENIQTRGKENLEKKHSDYLKEDYQPNQDWWGSSID